MQKAAPPASVRAWDGPTRLFKWTLVALVVAAPLTKWYGDVTLVQHKIVGYSILTLVIWRVLWGFVGSSTARFASFVRWPWTAAGYVWDTLRGRERRHLGHNPAGGWMILALLAVLAVQATTGLFATDDIIVDGPLRGYVSYATAKFLTGIHDVLPRLLLALAIVHVLVNAATTVFKDNLILAMITGRKTGGGFVDQAEARGGSPLAALVCLAIAAGIVFGGLALVGQSPFR
jgi:cytochrome b